MVLYHVLDNVGICVVKAVANLFHLLLFYHLPFKMIHYRILALLFRRISLQLLLEYQVQHGNKYPAKYRIGSRSAPVRKRYRFVSIFGQILQLFKPAQVK